MADDATLVPVRGAFRAVTRATVPSSTELDEAAWVRAEGVVEAALADRPASVRRQVALFLRILSLLSWLSFGRSLDHLTARQAYTLLAKLERSPLLILRRGIWGVRTLAFMGVYAQSDVQRRLGYGPASAGWEARGAGQGPWPERGGAAPPEDEVLVASSEDQSHG